MSEAESGELFPRGSRGEVLGDADCEALGRVADELRDGARALLVWFRRNPDKYRAAVDAARRIVERSGSGVAPLHLAFEMRHPPRGIAPVEIGNGEALFLARLAARMEPDLRRAFSFRDAAADAVFEAGWDGGRGDE